MTSPSPQAVCPSGRLSNCRSIRTSEFDARRGIVLDGSGLRPGGAGLDIQPLHDERLALVQVDGAGINHLERRLRIGRAQHARRSPHSGW